MSDQTAKQATPHDVLIQQLLDSRIPKTEREHAAAREITALRARLAQADEPHAWVSEGVCDKQTVEGRPRRLWWECEKGVGRPIYLASPPPRTPLSDEEIISMWSDIVRGGDAEVMSFARAIERKVRG